MLSFKKTVKNFEGNVAWAICNDDFQRNLGLQWCNNVATIRNNVATML